MSLLTLLGKVARNVAGAGAPREVQVAEEGGSPGYLLQERSVASPDNRRTTDFAADPMRSLLQR